MNDSKEHNKKIFQFSVHLKNKKGAMITIYPEAEFLDREVNFQPILLGEYQPSTLPPPSTLNVSMPGVSRGEVSCDAFYNRLINFGPKSFAFYLVTSLSLAL